MTIPPLLEDLALSGRPGAPFDSDEVAAACVAVRGECGWHVAPRVPHTILVSGPAGPRLVLPSLLVHSVSEVRDVRTGHVVTGWRPGASGMLVRDQGWPRGEDNLEVDLIDGHERCPADLVGVVVQRVRSSGAASASGERQFERSVGGVTTRTTYVDPSTAPAWPPAAEAVLARYRV